MNKYQEALNKVYELISDLDFGSQLKCAEQLKIIQELADKYNTIQTVFFKNEPMESADLTAIKLQELYNCINKLIEKNQKLKETVDDKETPKKAILHTSKITDDYYTCPKCRMLLSNDIYCSKCGQKLDWSDIDE